MDRARPENVFSLSSYVHISSVLSIALLFSGGLGRKGIGKPHQGRHSSLWVAGNVEWGWDSENM